MDRGNRVAGGEGTPRGGKPPVIEKLRKDRERRLCLFDVVGCVPLLKVMSVWPTRRNFCTCAVGTFIILATPSKSPPSPPLAKGGAFESPPFVKGDLGGFFK